MIRHSDCLKCVSLVLEKFGMSEEKRDVLNSIFGDGRIKRDAKTETGREMCSSNC